MLYEIFLLIMSSMETIEKTDKKSIDTKNLAFKAGAMGGLVGITTFPFMVSIGLRQSGADLALRSVAKSFPSHLAASQTKGAARNTGSALKRSASSELASPEASSSMPSEPSQPTSARSSHTVAAIAMQQQIALNQTLSHLDAVMGGYLANRTKLTIAGKDAGRMTTWNIWALTKAGYPLRWTSATIFYGALIQGVDDVAGALPIEDRTIRAATAGALTGTATTMVTYPLQKAHDAQVLATGMGPDGRLRPLSTLGLFKRARVYVAQEGMTAGAQRLLARGTLGLRIACGGAAFATAQVANDWLGDTPYDDAKNIFSRKA